MTARDDGGPAFPSLDADSNSFIGMSLRDYFAAKAMQGLLTNPALMNHARENGRMVANFHTGNIKAAFEIADMMIAERSKQ